MTEFAKELMKKIGFDKDEQLFFSGCAIKYQDNTLFKELQQKYNDDVWKNLKEVKEGIEKISGETGDNIYTVNVIFLLEACEILLPRFLAQGNSEELFYKTMSDIKVKLDECKQVYGIYGVFASLDWFAGFFEPSRYWLGRLQFEVTKSRIEDFEKDGVVHKKGDVVINVHIPSGQPMKPEDCFEAFDLACDHYKDLYNEKGYLVFECHSWLLFEDQRKFLNPESNISKFMDMFDLSNTVYEEKFGNGWRIFGAGNNETDPTKLPDHTSLLKAYKKWLCDGNKAGYSYGIRIHRKGDR